MKRLHIRLLFASILFMFLFLTGLGIVLGQFFFFFGDANMSFRLRYWLFLCITLSAFFLVSVLLISRGLAQYTKPIDDAAQVAKQLSSGDYKARVQLEETGADNDLALSINQIARNLQETSTIQEMEKERLHTLVESMGSGLLMIGREGAVNLVNRKFSQTFGFHRIAVIGKTFNTLGLPSELEQVINEVFVTETPCERQIALLNKGKRSYVSVYGAPVIGSHGSWLGIVVVLHDITELKRLEQIRKDFVANVSHELRTPVTSIKGFSETLLDGAMDDEVARVEFLSIIRNESERLHLLIDDLLELSTIEQEGFSLSFTSVDLREIAAQALKTVSGKLTDKQMTAEVLTSEEIIIEADPSRLVQVMVNLLSNAVTYSKEGTKVTIKLYSIQDNAIIEVIDEGIGIEESELSRLFERFYRVDRARSRESGGTGLGLAIVKHLIDAHGGEVSVESTVGIGSTFKIQLPIKQG